jgi:serine incorporator 1/3
MGALLSIPLVVPSVTGIGGWVLSCCGAAAVLLPFSSPQNNSQCTALCRPCGSCTSSIATRVAYAVLFLFNSMVWCAQYMQER